MQKQANSYIRVSLLLLLFCTGYVFPQSNTSIESQLEEAELIRSSEPSRFIDILEGLALQKENMSLTQLHSFNFLRAYQLSYSGELHEAINLANSILEKSQNKLLAFRTNILIANIYAVTQDWKNGLEHLNSALEWLPQVSDQEIYEQGILVAAVVYTKLGQDNSAKKYASKLISQASTKRNQCLAKQMHVEASLNLGEVDSTSINLIETYNLCNDIGETALASSMQIFKSQLLLTENEPQLALSLLTQHKAYIEENKYPPLLTGYYATLSDAYFTLNDINNASLYAKKAISSGKGIKINKYMVLAYQILADIYQQQGDFPQALAYYKLYADADKAYLDDAKARYLAAEMSELRFTEQQTQIALLDKQNALLKTERKLSQTEAENNRLFITLLVTVLLLLVMWIYKSRVTQQRLREMAEFDELTGIFNRRHFVQAAKSAIDYCQNTQQPVGCILFDLDEFKKINDHYGHSTGDWVLRKVAKACQEVGRKNDIFARLGGEEFAFMLPGCDAKRTLEYAEKCRKAIESISTNSSGHLFTVTASFGVTDSKQSYYDLDKLMSNADAAMYQAKHSGRNQVLQYDPAFKLPTPAPSTQPA